MHMVKSRCFAQGLLKRRKIRLSDYLKRRNFLSPVERHSEIEATNVKSGIQE